MYKRQGRGFNKIGSMNLKAQKEKHQSTRKRENAPVPQGSNTGQRRHQGARRLLAIDYLQTCNTKVCFFKYIIFCRKTCDVNWHPLYQCSLLLRTQCPNPTPNKNKTMKGAYVMTWTDRPNST